MRYQIGKNALPVITGPIIPTGWLWAMLRMMPVPNCCPGNAGYRPCRFPSGCRKIPGIEYVPFSCLHNTVVNFIFFFQAEDGIRDHTVVSRFISRPDRE